MNDISYFDVACEKYGFLRNFLHYLNASSLDVVLKLCSPNVKKIEICDELNKINHYRPYTISRLNKKASDIRGRLYKMQFHSDLFGITHTIKPLSLNALQRIVEDYREKESEDSEE